MILEIKFGTGVWQPVGYETAFTALNQLEVNKAAGELHFMREVVLTDPHEFPSGTVVCLRGRDSNSAAWEMLFSGKISSVSRSHSAGRIDDEYVAKDVWDELERTVYMVFWSNENAFNRSHLTLFRTEAGDRMSIGSQFSVVLDYAIARGIPVSYVSAEMSALSYEPPADEQVDFTIVDVIKKGLRWYPGVHTSFEYVDGGGAVLHILPDSSRSVVDLDARLLVDLGATRRDDLLLKGVSLYYEVCDEELNRTTNSISSDTAGEVWGPGVLSHTTQIDGNYLDPVVHQLTLNAIEVPDPWNANSLSFNSQLFNLGDIDLITYWSRGTAYRPYWVPAWNSSLTNYGITRQTVDVTASFRVKNGDGTYTYYTNESITISTTDSPPGLYSYTEYVEIAGEPLPGNIASQVYDAYKNLLYQGGFTREFSGLSGRLRLTNGVKLFNANPAWAETTHAVQSVLRDYFNETETVQFGVPEHLGLSDYVEMLRYGREVRKSSRRVW